jgi:nucleotide-binding universal stress UspA family protein
MKAILVATDGSAAAGSISSRVVEWAPCTVTVVK